MNNSRKSFRFLAVLTVVALLFCAVGVRTTDSSAVGTYWLTGGHGSSKLVFTGKKFKFSGEWGKGSTMNKSVTTYYSDPARFKKTLKKGKNLRTGSVGSDGLRYDSSPNLETGTNLVGITASVKIKNNKVVEVIYSAI